MAIQDNIAILDFDYEQGTLVATVFTKGTLDVRTEEILPDDYFMDEIDFTRKLLGQPVLGYVVKHPTTHRPIFYSINFEHGEL